MSILATENGITFEALRLSLSLVRKARAAMGDVNFDNGQSQAEANFHLGCAEIALLRLVLEEEREFNGKFDEHDGVQQHPS